MNYYLMREGATCYIWALRFNPQVLPYRRSNQYLMGKWAEKKQKATCLRKKAAFQRDECRELLQVTNAYMNISLLAFYVYIYHMLWFVSMTPLSHCILKQLLVNHINCKDITDYTQSYHSRKATRQPTHFYNSKGTVGGEWNLTRHIGSRAQWDLSRKVNLKLEELAHMFFYVKLNFKLGLFSSTFWFEHSLRSENAYL